MIEDMVGLLNKVSNYIRGSCDNAVIGLSGGADSTLVACLCNWALNPEHVFGVHLPYNDLDKNTFNWMSVEVANILGINQKTIDIGKSIEIMAASYGGLEIMSTINKGNLRSRTRMVALYSYARMLSDAGHNRVRVIGTGNLSEDFIGYDSKGGDALCDFFPIGSLLKSEVYELLENFANMGMIRKDMINRTPSAGLWDGQTDEKELGYTYTEMEPYVIAGTKGNFTDDSDSIGAFVRDRHFANKHKHEAPPVLDLREFCKE